MSVPESLRPSYDDNWIVSHFDKSLSEGCIYIYLQPQVDMKGNILGAEVLARWIEKNGDMIPVGQFIPALINAELITRMDLYIWETAVKKLSEWKGTPLEKIHLSVNVEPNDIIKIDVPSKLKELCQRHHVDISKIHVEITERGFDEDFPLPDNTIAAFHENGITVEIDDFGRGSSALSLLKNLDVDALKLDRGFISPSSENHNLRGKIILECVIGLAKKLKTLLIVEGVETGRQKQCIQNAGCNIYQGFYFSEPIPVTEFETLFLKTANALES